MATKSGFWPSSPWMSGLLSSGGGLTDTFNMAKRHVLWPQLATTESTAGSHTGVASAMFGGLWTPGSAALNEYIEWDDVVLQPGTYRISLLTRTHNNQGIYHVSHDGVDTSARLDCYSATSTDNQIVSDTFTVATKTRGAIRLTSASKNASSSWYYQRPQQIEIVKTSAESDAGASLDDLPWVSDAPVVSISAGTGPATLTQSTSAAWGSYVRWTDAINEYSEIKVDLKEGTYDLDCVCLKSASGGIATLTIDGGASEGTFDTYNGSTTYNNTESITSITIATSGVKTIRLTCSSKHASSSGYNLDLQWLQFRKTTTTGAITATGATYGRETLELWPWFADTTDSDTFALSSSDLHYGTYAAGTPAINDTSDFEIGVNSGTYDVTEYGQTTGASGIVHMSIDGGSDLDTVDLYSGSTTRNVASAMSGSLAAGTLNMAMDSKNGSSSNYDNNMTFTRLVRTGA